MARSAIITCDTILPYFHSHESTKQTPSQKKQSSRKPKDKPGHPCVQPRDWATHTLTGLASLFFSFFTPCTMPPVHCRSLFPKK